MTSAQLVARIDRLQCELDRMKVFQRSYLNKRKDNGIHTSTDREMERHQHTIAETLDLLETIKADVTSEHRSVVVGDKWVNSQQE